MEPIINGTNIRIKIMNNVMHQEKINSINGEMNMIRIIEIMIIDRRDILRIGINEIAVIMNIIIGKITVIIIIKDQGIKLGQIAPLYGVTTKIIGIVEITEVEIVEIEGGVEVKARSISQGLIGLKNVMTKI